MKTIKYSEGKTKYAGLDFIAGVIHFHCETCGKECYMADLIDPTNFTDARKTQRWQPRKLRLCCNIVEVRQPVFTEFGPDLSGITWNPYPVV